MPRMPGAPALPETPLELITPRPGEGYSTFSKLKWPITGFGSTFLSVMIANRLKRRPMWSGMPFTIFLSGVVAYCCVIARDIKHASRNEADALIRHYITLHPDDFPPYERKVYRDVYRPFDPQR